MKTKVLVVKSLNFILVNVDKQEIIWENKYGFMHLQKSYVNELLTTDNLDNVITELKRIVEQFIFKTQHHGFEENESYNDPIELWDNYTEDDDLQKLYSLDFRRNDYLARASQF